jgi:hypothetical protein
MASIKSINFLPQIFRSDPNNKFIAATVDQLTSEPDFVKLSGYIGRQFSPAYKPGDTYVTEPDPLRQNYQLEPAVSISDAKKNVTFFSSYPDLLQKIAYHGGLTDNQSRLFSSTSYNFNSLIDIDKLVNFHQYLWMPDGPPEVGVSAFSDTPVFDYRVFRDATIPAFRLGAIKDGNPTVTLTRGETYTFRVDSPDNPFYIQTRLGLNYSTEFLRLSREILGVERNGGEAGSITFAVPLKDAQNEFGEAPSAGDVDFAVDVPYKDIQRRLVSELERESGGIDGVSGILDGRTLVFVQRYDNSSDWQDPGIFDFDPFDSDETGDAWSGGSTVGVPDRYNIWRIRVVENHAGDKIVRLEPYKKVDPGFKVTIKQGKKYAGVDFLKNIDDNMWNIVPIITAPLSELYYQDGNSDSFGGKFVLRDPGDNLIDINTDVIGQKNYTSPNGIRFTNGLVVRFDNTAFPTAYRNNLFVVGGVGRSITLVGAGNYVVPEPYAATDRLQTPDYITIDRASEDLNAWTRSNRWFHQDLLVLAAQYRQDPDILLLADQYQRAQRPIIEFDPNIELYSHGSNAKAMVDILDFTVTNAFKQVEGQEAFTFQLPNGKTKDVTAGMRIIFAADEDPDVSGRIYLVQYIVTSQGSQIHLVTQDTSQISTYYVDDHVILENQNYSSIPGISYSQPYPAIGAVQAAGRVVLNTTSVKSLTAEYGGLNYLTTTQPSVAVDTQFTQPAKFEINYATYTYLENIHILDGGTGYTTAAVLNVPSPNSVEFTTATAPGESLSAIQSQLIYVQTLPAGFSFATGDVVYLIGPGIPGGTRIIGVDSGAQFNTSPILTVSQPVTVSAGVVLTTGMTTATVAEDSQNSTTITVDDSSVVSAGMIVSGGKIPLNIINITTGLGANPAQVTVGVPHNLSNGDIVYITQIESGPIGINNATFFVKIVDEDTFSLFTDAGLTASYDATNSATYNTTSPSGVVASKFINYGLVGVKVAKVVDDTTIEVNQEVTLEVGTVLTFAGVQARGEVKVVDGEVVSVWIKNGGAGYSSNVSLQPTVTITNAGRTSGFDVEFNTIFADRRIDYFSITNAGTGYVIDSDITARVIDSVTETTNAETVYGSDELKFAASSNIQYIRPGWQAWLVLPNGLYADFAQIPQLDEVATGPRRLNNQYFADTNNTLVPTVYTVSSVDLVNNSVILAQPIDSRDNDNEEINLPANSVIFFTCKTRYFTEDGTANTRSLGLTRSGYRVIARNDYQFDAATVVSNLELDNVLGLQVGMKITDAGNSFGEIRILSIDSFTNSVIIDRNIAIPTGTILQATSAASLLIELEPASIKEIILTESGAEYTAAPLIEVDPIKDPVQKIISSAGATGEQTGEIIVNSLDGIDIGSVAKSEFQESGFGITTGGDVIRVLSKRQVQEAGGIVSNRLTLGIARYFNNEFLLLNATTIFLPNVIGLEVGMSIDDDQNSFVPTTIVEIDSGLNTVTLATAIGAPIGIVFRFFKPVQQPVFGDVFATFTVTARIAAVIASRNITVTDFNDTTPETYEVGDTVLVGTPTNVLQTAKNVPEYNQYQAVAGVNGRITWEPAQKKSKINQAPRFDVFDSAGNSLGNQKIYLGSKFAGTRIFSYTDGTGTPDPILGFRIKYKNFNNQGDILFTNSFYTDTFTYLNNGVETTLLLRGYDLKKFDPVNKVSRRINQWEPIEADTEQYQTISYNFDNTTTYFEIDILPRLAATQPTLRVYVNNKQLLENQYSVVKVGARFAVLIEPAFMKTDAKVDIEILSNTNSTIGHYQLPVNFEVNPFNSTFSEITLGQVRNHLVTMTKNHYGVEGNVLQQNNLRDLDYSTWQGSLLQHSSPVLFSHLFLNDRQADAVSAIEHASKEYTRFKNRFLDMAGKTDLGLKQTTLTADVDKIIALVLGGKNPRSAWYSSDMLPWGKNKTITRIPVIDAQVRRYEIPVIFNNSELSNRAVLIYFEDPATGTRRQLIKGIDFVFEKQIPAITLSDSLVTSYTSFLVVEDYNTLGNFIPETPTKLGLYPKFLPRKYLDNTYQTPVQVIQGHDGSIMPAFNDFRDNLLLELELRIYNNIKTEYESGIFNHYDLVPGKWRKTGYTRAEFNQVLTKRFLKWVGANRVDYAQNKYWKNDNAWTWSYSSFTDIIDGETLPGFWRGIYMYFFDTDRPHQTPWEMLGFSEKPTWWESYYGPGPYTGGNLALWGDLERGYIADGPQKGIDKRFARPGLLKLIPVDENGILISPEKLFLASFDFTTTQGNFEIGDVGPAETAWRKSSDYPFALQVAMALTFPGYYFGSLIDTTRYFYDTELKQYLHKETNSRISPTNVIVTDDGVTSGTVTNTAGYINWLKDYLVARGINGTKYLQDLITSAEVTLAYRMAGFSDKRFINVIADQSSPGSSTVNIVVPDQNYRIVLNKSTPIQRAVYSAVIIEKTANGYSVSGYNITSPFFTIIPSLVTNNAFNITVLDEIATIFNDYTPVKIVVPYGYEFNNVQGVVDFLNSYQRFLVSQGFDFEDFNNELNKQQDFILSAEEFMMWAQQGWGVGTILVLSPIFDKITYTNEFGVVDSISDSLNSSKILDQNFSLVKNSHYTVTREDTKFTLKSLFAHTLSLVDMDVVQYEHIMLFDNVTVFNDVMYLPELGIRQQRLKLSGHKSNNWTGQLNPGGLMYNSPTVDAWKPNINYRSGSLIEYKDKVYVATKEITAASSFDFTSWQISDSNQIATGMLPNWATLADNAEKIYDVDKHPVDENLDAYGHGLIGFRERDYLSDFQLDRTTQVKFYQGYIKRKGSMNAINALTSAKLSNIENQVQVFEDWAIRVGEYGTLGGDQYVELQLDEAEFTQNPDLVVLAERDAEDVKGAINISPDQVYGYSELDYSPMVTKTRSADEQRLSDLVLAGYPNIDDVNDTLFDIANIEASKSLVPGMGSGYKLWVAKDFNGNWNVFRMSETNTLVSSIDYALGGEMVINTDVNYDLLVGDIVVVKNFDPGLDGIYLVKTVRDIRSFSVTLDDESEIAATLRRQQTVTGNGILLKATPVRVKEIKEIVNDTPIYQWRNGDKVWVDDDTGTGRWAVYQKIDGWSFKEPLPLRDEDVRQAEGYGTAVKLNSDNQMMLVGAPSHTEGSLRGIQALEQGQDYILPTFVVGLPEKNNGQQAQISTVTLSNGAIKLATLTNPGFGYQTVPEVTITDEDEAEFLGNFAFLIPFTTLGLKTWTANSNVSVGGTAGIAVGDVFEGPSTATAANVTVQAVYPLQNLVTLSANISVINTAANVSFYRRDFTTIGVTSLNLKTKTVATTITNAYAIPLNNITDINVGDYFGTGAPYTNEVMNVFSGNNVVIAKQSVSYNNGDTLDFVTQPAYVNDLITGTGVSGSVTVTEVTSTDNYVFTVKLNSPVSALTGNPVFKHGSGAIIEPVLTASNIANVVIVSAGSGYANTPNFRVEGGSGAGAIITPVFSTNAIPLTKTLTDVAIVDAGSGYTSVPVVRVEKNSPGVTPVLSVKLTRTSIGSLAVKSQGSGYRRPVITIAAPESAVSGNINATASLTVTRRSIPRLLDLTQAGSGYTSVPATRIQENSQNPEQVTGSGAVIEAIMPTGTVRAFSRVNANSEDILQINSIKAPNSYLREFGASLDMGYSIAAIGAPGTYQNRGSVCVAKATGGQWAITQIINHPGAAAAPLNSRFGESLAMSRDENWLYVGAPGQDKVYVYAKQNPFARAVLIDYQVGTEVYFLSGLYDIQTPQELRVLGASGRVYEAGIDYTVDEGSLTFTAQAGVSDRRITVTKAFISSRIRPQIVRGAVVKVYELESIPESPESIFVLGASGTAYVLDRDYEIINLKQIRWLTDDFATEESFAIDAIQNYYRLIDILEAPTGDTNSRFGAALSTNAEGYQLVVGAPNYQDSVTAIVATTVVSLTVVLRDIKTIKVGYSANIGPNAKVIAVDKLTNQITFDTVVSVDAGDSVVFTSPPAIGRAYVFDRSYERFLQRNTTPLRTLSVRENPRGPVRVMIDRNTLVKDYDYFVTGRTINFNVGIPYAAAIKVDINVFTLVQQFDPELAVRNGEFGKSVDVTADNLNIAISQPGYNDLEYYNGTVFRYINQGLAYAKVVGKTVPLLQASAGLLKFNDNNIAFGGIDLADNGTTTNLVVAGINGANIVGLTASGRSELFSSAVLYEYIDPANIGLGYRLIGSSSSANYFDLSNIVPDHTTTLDIITKSKPVSNGVSVQRLIRGTDFNFVYVESTDVWQVHLTEPLLETLTQTQVLLVQIPVTIEITRGTNYIDLLPGTNITPSTIGVDTYILSQTLKHPGERSSEKYGNRVKFDTHGETLMVSSRGGTTLKYTTFDKEITTIDKDSTRFIDTLKGSGAVYIYDYLAMDNATQTDPALFLYNQNLSNSFIKFADNFGVSVDINDGWALVGADGYDNTDLGIYNSGIVHVFRNPTKVKSWSKLRQYSNKVDIEYVNKLLLYDLKQQVTVTQPDYVDPAKGKILGIADQEIDYKTSYDPAAYNVSTRTNVNLDTTAPWYTAQVGKVWWNLDTCRYIDYEQSSLTYRSRHWGELFPGSTIEVCEWVESTVLPSDYFATLGDGVAKYPDNSAYVVVTAVDDATGLVMTKYYYWVLNKNSLSNLPNRRLSANTIRRLILDPTTSNSPFVAVVAPNAFNFYGFKSFLKGNNTVFRYEYSKIRSDNIAHSEYELVAEGNALSTIPRRVLDKLVDSLAGANAIGELVPDPTLIVTSQTGIQIRPRQSMFKDQQSAALIFTQYLNSYFTARPVGQFNIEKLTIKEPIPDSSFYQSTVPNYETLTYIDLTTVYDGYRILVQQDETVGGYWTVYFYRQASQTWFLERIQAYDTTRYWKYVDWYASGYTSSLDPDIFLQTYQDIQKIIPQAGQLIRVNTGTSGGWEWYTFDSKLNVVNVAIQNGTIEFSSLIYRNVINQVGYDAGGFDTAGYGKTIAIEIRNIVDAMIYDVFSGVASDDLDLNDMFFAMVGYILTEQKQVDWLLKTSFMSVVHKRDQLQQIVSYQKDNQTYYEDYINEVKPYRSTIKQYLLDYTNLESAPMMVTDFDLPAIYDRSQANYRVLDSDNNVDLAIIRAGEAANWLSNFSYSIQNITIINGGSGYIDPLMVFTSPTGSGTVAVPSAVDGVIVSITVEEGGTGYLDVPTADVSGSTGQGFSGIVIMGVDYATVAFGGTGYEVGDILTYTDGTGTAVFQVAKVTGGVVEVVNTTSAGEFRTTTFLNVSTGTTGTGNSCRLNLVYKVVSVLVDVGGEGYITGAPRVVISGGGRGGGAKATAVVNKGSITSVILTNSGSGYTSVPEVTFVGGGGSGAKAYAQLTQSTGAVGSKTQNKTIRSITTKMKFDRTAYSTNVDRWKPLRTYHTGDVVVIPDNVTRTFVNLPDQILPQADNAYRVLKTLLAAETFDNNLLSDTSLFQKLGGAELENTLERIGAYNRPGTPDAGRVFRSTDAKLLESGDINNKIVSIENNWNRVSVAVTIPPNTQYRYAIVGNRTTMAVSVDGVTWIHADLRDQGVNLRGIAFVNESKWIAYGTNGSTFETTDGINWNRVLINEYRYSPNVDNVAGQVFSNAAATIDITDATSFSSSFGKFAMVVGSRGIILLNSYGSENNVGNRWISARVPNETVDVQYLTITNKDFGFVGELDRVIYDGAPTAFDGNGDPTAWNPSVAKTGTGYFYIPSQQEISGLNIPRLGFKKGFVIVAGVNGYIYFSSYQNLEDLHNGFYRGYNYDNGKNITGSNNDLAPVDENYPWVKTLVPRSVSGIGDGVSGEHIADIAIGSEPDIWCVAVGSGGTLLWNVLDLFTQLKSGNLAGQDTFGKTLISHSVDPFLEWREFDNDNFEYPLTKAVLTDENFTSVEWDGEKFIAVTESNMIYWGYPGAKNEAYIDLAPVSQDLNVQSLYAAASWSAFSNVDTVTISVPLASLSGVPVVGMTLQSPVIGWPKTIITSVTLNGGGNNLNSTIVVETLDGSTFSDSARTLQRLVFFYGITENLQVGDEITFTGPLIPGTNIRETVTLTVSRPADANDNTSEIWVSGYNTVAYNWQVSGTGIPPGCLVGAVGKFAQFNWKIAPGSKKSGTRSFSSVAVNLVTVELTQPLVGQLPKGTVINFFDPTGSNIPKTLMQAARAQTKFLVIDNNIDILPGYSVAAIQTATNQDGTAFYALPGNTFVASSRQYVLTGGVSRLEKDIADKVPGIAYSGVKVTGTVFTEDVTASIPDWQPYTDYSRGDKIKYVGQVFTAKQDIEGSLILNDLTVWESTPVNPDADELDTEISSSFTDSLLGQRPEDIVIDGGKFIDRFSSHAPEELVPGAITDLLQMTVFTKDPEGSGLTVGFKIFSDQQNPAEFYRISSAATTTLAEDLDYLSTQIVLTDVSGLPDPNPTDNRPGSVFINGEKIIYLGIDREENKLLNIRRGASRTSIPLLHTAGSLVSDASAQQLFDADFVTQILENSTFDNFLGNTATYYTADVSSIQQGRLFIDLGNIE